MTTPDESNPLLRIPPEWMGLDGPNGELTINFRAVVLLAMSGTSPDAIHFQRWVAEAVDCIRTHGCYPAPKQLLRNSRAVVVTQPGIVGEQLGPKFGAAL